MNYCVLGRYVLIFGIKYDYRNWASQANHFGQPINY